MPFDQSDETISNLAILSALTRRADAAFEASERERCVEIIQQIYDLLDSASTAQIVRLNQRNQNTRRRNWVAV